MTKFKTIKIYCSQCNTLLYKYYKAFNEFDTANKTSVMEEIVGKALTGRQLKLFQKMEF